MTFTVETGLGVLAANAYSPLATFKTYHNDRGNDFSNFTDPEIQQGIIAATDFIDSRWGDRFLGRKEFLALKNAQAALTFTANPLDAEVVVLGSRTYTFNTTLGGADSILIGADTNASIDNLAAAVNVTTGEGTTYGTGTVVHADITGKNERGDVFSAKAKLSGTAGNLLVSTTTVTGATWSSATLVGGSDTGVPQPLQFPRINLLDRDGALVLGIPTKLLNSAAEYAFRALTITLMPDPGTDPTGRNILSKRTVVGPLDISTTYEGGAPAQLMIPYPLADRLLSEYVSPAGRAIRA